MRYRESLPPPELASLVACFWELAVPDDLPSPVTHDVFPDGLASLVHLRGATPSRSWLRVLGPRTRVFQAPLHGGDVFRGVRWQAAAAGEVFRAAPILRDRNLDCADVHPALFTALKGPLDGALDFEQAQAQFRAALCSLPAMNLDERVAAAARLIEAAGGEVRIAAVARHVALSRRQLERRFLRSTGLTAKAFARARRLRATVLAILGPEGPEGPEGPGGERRWSALAADLGFSDQAHLGHELIRAVGRTPSSFARALRAIEHGPLVR